MRLIEEAEGHVDLLGCCRRNSARSGCAARRRRICPNPLGALTGKVTTDQEGLKVILYLDHSALYSHNRLANRCKCLDCVSVRSHSVCAHINLHVEQGKGVSRG
jgi:hypothetical protein